MIRYVVIDLRRFHQYQTKRPLDIVGPSRITMAPRPTGPPLSHLSLKRHVSAWNVEGPVRPEREPIS